MEVVMFRKLGLAGAVLGTVISLALPVSGLAIERNGRNDDESGYLSAQGTRRFATPANRIRFDYNSRREVGFDGKGAHSQIRFGRPDKPTDRKSEHPGLRNSGGFDRR
jgi:hypothetical protein